MLNVNNHFIVNSISKNINSNKLIDSITLSTGIECTNGVTNIIPAGALCKFVTLLQYVMTIVITGYFLF
jgi:hypothetical protein